MAPKKKDDAKKGKDDAKKGKDDAKKGKDDAKKGKDVKIAPAGPSILENEVAKHIGKLVGILLTIVSITLTVMYQTVYIKYKEVPDALKNLRDVVVKYNKALKEKSDDEILKAAEDMAQYVLDKRRDIYALKNELEYTRRLINQGWRIYNRTYWYFTKPIFYDDMVLECKKKGLKMEKVLDQGFEKFLESQLLRFRTGIWVPMVKKWNNKKPEWFWEIDKELMPLEKGFWDTSQPNHAPHEDCCYIRNPCATTNFCWHDIRCASNRVGYCRGKEVEKKWLVDPVKK